MTEAAVNPVYEKLLAGNQPRAPIGSGEARDGNRILSIPSRGNGRFVLRFVDTRHGEYVIPVGRVATRKRDEAPVHERNVLVPVLPRVYTTPDLDPAKCAVPRAPGWLYVFKNGYLWRELEVLPQGWLRDVNLHKYAGRDVRPATVEKDNRLLLPYRLDGEAQAIRMAYADVQWSWARINMLGGMDPADFRLHPDHLPPMPQDMGYSDDQIAEAQNARLQQIDLSGFDAGFPVQPAEGRTARIENVEHANDRLVHIRLHRKANIPVVYLHDPLGVMLENLEAYRRTEAKLLAEVEKAKAHEHYRSAVLTWQVFFNEDLWKKVRRRKRQRGPTHYVDNSDEAEALRRAAREMDENLIREILRVEPRRQLRQALRELKQRHFDWLEGRDARGQPLEQIAPDHVAIETVLIDYASQPREGYIQLWATLNLALLYANHDPATLDAGLDRESERDRTGSDADPGKRYLERLSQPDHPLHVMLFPAREQVDETDPESAVDPERDADEIPNPDGRFRPVAFAGALAAHSLRESDLAMALVKEAEKIVAGFVLQFQHQWQAASRTAKTHVYGGLVRLIKAANHPDLRGLHLIERGAELQGKVIIDGELTVLEKLKRAQRREAFKAAVNNPGKDRVNVIDPRTGKAVFSQAITDVADNKGLPLQVDDPSWAELWRETDTNGVVRARGRFLVVDEISPYALKYHRSSVQTERGVSAAVQGIEVASKVLPPLVAVVEMFNVQEMYQRMRARRDAKNVASFVLSSFALFYVVIDVPLKIAGEDKGAKFWADLMPRKTWREPTEKFLTSKLPFRTERGIEFRTVGTIGAGVSAAGAVMAGWDAFDSLTQGDDDAAAAHGVQALAGLALALCDLGAASTATSGLLAGFGPWGWAALAVFLAAGLVANMLKDTPVEKWAKHGPFARDPADRGTFEYSRPVRDAEGRVLYTGTGRNRTMMREPLPPEKMYEALMSLLMSPGITVQLDRATVPATVLLDITAPGFEPGRSSLNVLATGEIAYRMSPQERAIAIRNGYTDTAAMESFTSSGSQEPLRLREWQPLLGEDGVSQVGIRYRYALPTLGGQGDYRITVRTRARHITADQLIIPTIPGEEADRPADPKKVDPQVPGWVYAEQVVKPA